VPVLHTTTRKAQILCITLTKEFYAQKVMMSTHISEKVLSLDGQVKTLFSSIHFTDCADEGKYFLVQYE
jgi:hypothetical protein